MAYRGGWSARRRPGRAGPADTVDHEHLVPPTEDYGTATWAGPSVPEMPGYLISDAHAEAAGWSTTSTRGAGGPVDRTPRDHNQGAADPGQRTEEEAREQANAARDHDQGATHARRYAHRAGRAAGERFITELREQPPINGGSRNQLDLQITSRPDNTVDSRNGREVNRWVDRKFGYRWRSPDLRPIRPNLAAAAVNSPPLEDANQYVSPFGTLARRTRKTMTPMLRRIPRPWDEEIITDGTDGANSPAEFQAWGL